MKTFNQNSANDCVISGYELIDGSSYMPLYLTHRHTHNSHPVSDKGIFSYGSHTISFLNNRFKKQNQKSKIK